MEGCFVLLPPFSKVQASGSLAIRSPAAHCTSMVQLPFAAHPAREGSCPAYLLVRKHSALGEQGWRDGLHITFRLCK